MRRTIRHLLTAALAVGLLFALFCTINDDNGNPIEPGIAAGGGGGTIVGGGGGGGTGGEGDSTGEGGGGGGGLTSTLVPSIVAENMYAGIGDTVQVVVTLYADTARGAGVIKEGNIKVTSIRPDDYASPAVLTTNVNGQAIVKFSSGTEGTGGIKLSYGSAAERNVTIVVTDDPPRNITINASPPRLPADGASKSVITVQVKNDDNNPIVGDVIKFSADMGLITAQATTDADGKATAQFTSEQRNAIATITATLKSDGSRNATALVEFYGVSISATAEPETIKPDTVEKATVKAVLLDGGQNPIVGQKITFVKRNAQTRFVDVDAAATVADSSLTTTTDNSGVASCTIKSLATGVERIYVRAAGAEGYADVTYSGQTLTVDWADGRETPGIGDSSTFIISYTESNGRTPVSSAKLMVTVTMGRLADNPADSSGVIFARVLELNPSDNGKKTFSFRNPGFTGTASIYVKGETTGESATAKKDITFKALNASRIEIVATPDVISTGGGQATLKATVYDAGGNRVDDATISFNIIAGPGGGEYLSPPTAVTGKSGEAGVASSYLVAGSIPSSFKSVQVVASTYGYNGIISNAVDLTIAGPPHHITVRSNIDNITAGTATYGLKIAALVSDINNNPVPDGWEVTFSSRIEGYTYYMLGNATVVNGECKMDTIPVDVDKERFSNKDVHSPIPPGYYDDVNMSRIPDTAAICNDAKDSVIYVLEAGQSPTPNYYGQYKFEFSGGSRKLIPIGVPDFDLDLGRGGVIDPSASTTVILAKTAKTKGGIADNEIIYGQSDAGKVRVMLWAECKGLVTSNPEEIRLPRSESAKNWNPFK